MTHQPTDADLAVLREAAEYAGCEQPAEGPEWRVINSDGVIMAHVGQALVLARPYAADFEHALRERLVADGWSVELFVGGRGNAIATVWKMMPGGAHANPHPLLALAYAAQRAGAFKSKEEA